MGTSVVVQAPDPRWAVILVFRIDDELKCYAFSKNQYNIQEIVYNVLRNIVLRHRQVIRAAGFGIKRKLSSHGFGLPAHAVDPRAREPWLRLMITSRLTTEMCCTFSINKHAQC